jgi:two-component system sensor histidine kinase ChvG
MVSDTNIKKTDGLRSANTSVTSHKRSINRRRFTPRRFLLSSRLSQLILLTNFIGLTILVGGALAMSRFETALIDGKIDNLESLAATVTTVLADDATGSGQRSALDLDRAAQVMRGVNIPEAWRVRLFDRAGRVVIDSLDLDDRIEVGVLEPITTDQARPLDRPSESSDMDQRISAVLHNLPWRQARRDRMRRDLDAEIERALAGEAISGASYDADDRLLVAATLPVRRVQEVLGAVTVESRDVDNIVNAERQALGPIIGLALLAALLSSLALILFITLPMRHLARAAEHVSRNAENYEAIPDLSRRKDEIGDLSVVMRTMTRELYNRVDDIANFAADVAHEIKNPLTSLRSAADTLRVARTDEDREKLIAIITQDVSRMTRLITDISDASKVDANLARDTPQTLNVRDILSNIAIFYEQTAQPDQARVVSEVDFTDPVYIRVFENPFAQVLRNLIDNALTFSPPDGLILVQASASDTKVRIVVMDEGPGIPPENLETVFERFYTERPEGATFGSHSGLGLAICRQIMTAHKGRIWADNLTSESGDISGARFTLELPRQAARMPSASSHGQGL